MPGPAILALTGLLFLLFLIPTRRLQLAGWPARALGSYLGGMLLLGLVAAELRGPTRFLVPILVIGYIAPFVTLRSGIDRLLGGGRRLHGGSPRRKGGGPDVRVERPPMRSVSGAVRDVPPEDRADRDRNGETGGG
jgi:hypothetical protein